MSKIYVASSWRNKYQEHVVSELRSAGHDVYDFKHPDNKTGFSWSVIDLNWRQWTLSQYCDHLKHPIAEAGYKADFEAMEWADTFVGVMPFGISSSLEMGWAAGHGKKTILLLHGKNEPELMTKMLDHVCISLAEVIELTSQKRNSE